MPSPQTASGAPLATPTEAALVSVVVPTYQAKEFLIELCASLAAQTYPHFEVLILSDGCDDHLQPGLDQFRSDSRFHFDAWTPNRGVGATTAKLFERVGGDYWCHPGADDLLSPEFIERRLEIMQRAPDVDVIFGQGIQIDETGKEFWYHAARVLSERLAAFDGQIIEPRRMLRLLLQENFVNVPSVFCRTATTLEIVRRIGQWRFGQDMQMWLMLAGAGRRFYYDHRIFHSYRMHSGQLSQAPELTSQGFAEFRLMPLLALRQAAQSSELAGECLKTWGTDLYALWVARAASMVRRRVFKWEWHWQAAEAYHGRRLSKPLALLDFVRVLPRGVKLHREEAKRAEKQIYVNGLRKIDDPIFRLPSQPPEA